MRTSKWTGPLPLDADAATAVVRSLTNKGHEAYLVGGAIRDLLLGHRPGDWDVATSATIDEIAACFPRVEVVGESFGVSLVMQAGSVVETATFRSDGDYSDGRRPDSVRMPVSLVEDSKRRDFTINALYLDPATGRILDPQDGVKDCHDRLLRTVGNPTDRFAEDGLRLLRAPRLAASCGLTPVPETLAALTACRDGIRRIAGERIGAEVSRILTGPAPAEALQILADTGLLKIILPEVEAMRGVPQPPEFHPEGDVWTHTLEMLRHSPARSLSLGLALLLHDVGKPQTIQHRDRIRFNGHASAGANLTRIIGSRLRLAGHVVDRAVELVRRHMHFLEVHNMRESTLKRFLRLENFGELLELHRLDCLGSHGDLTTWEFCRRRLAEFQAEGMYPPPLLTGTDLLALGYKAGPRLGEILQALEDACLEGRLEDEEAARRWVQTRFPPDIDLPDNQ